MRRFLIKTLLYALPLLILLMGVNYLGDAAKVFDNDYEPSIARIIGSGKYATNIDNYDERLLQKELITHFKTAPTTVVLGSSRMMLINKTDVGDSMFFNSSVTGASIEDFMIIYQMYKEADRLPKRMIIGIDPWTFNKNNGLARWKSVAEYYYRYTRTENPSPDDSKWDKYRQIVSPSYFQSSVKYVRMYNEKPEPTTVLLNYTNTKLTDGSITYGSPFRNATAEQIAFKVKAYTSSTLYALKDFTAPAPELEHKLEQLVGEIRAQGIHVDLCMMPYHPQVYKVVEKKYRPVLETEAYVRKFGQKMGLTVYGSFDPAVSGLDKTNFYDGMHLKESGIAKVIKP